MRYDFALGSAYPIPVKSDRFWNQSLSGQSTGLQDVMPYPIVIVPRHFVEVKNDHDYLFHFV
jgi:hypothetical protein